MHWLWGFSDQIKSWLPGVCAYLRRKCGQSWLHSCWFSFTRAYMYGKGKLKSPDIVGELSPVLWKQTFRNPRRKQQGRMGDRKHLLPLHGGGPAPMAYGLGNQGLGLGESWDFFTSSAMLGIPNHKERYLMGCVNSLCCSCLWTGDLCVIWYPVCGVTSFMQTALVP